VRYLNCIMLLVVPLIFSTLARAEIQENNRTALQSSEMKIKDVERIYYVNKPVDTTRWTQNPTRALFKSLIFPGAGQFDNKSYIKGTIIFSFEVALIGAVVHYTEKASRARRAYESAKNAEMDFSLDDQIPLSYGSAAVGDAVLARLFIEFRDARDEQNLFRWYLGAFVFLSMFDAFVDAHLAQFPKYDKKFSFDIGSNEKDMVAVRLSYNFW
jgi:hypothetical protein